MVSVVAYTRELHFKNKSEDRFGTFLGWCMTVAEISRLEEANMKIRQLKIAKEELQSQLAEDRYLKLRSEYLSQKSESKSKGTFEEKNLDEPTKETSMQPRRLVEDTAAVTDPEAGPSTSSQNPNEITTATEPTPPAVDSESAQRAALTSNAGRAATNQNAVEDLGLVNGTSPSLKVSSNSKMSLDRKTESEDNSAVKVPRDTSEPSGLLGNDTENEIGTESVRNRPKFEAQGSSERDSEPQHEYRHKGKNRRYKDIVSDRDHSPSSESGRSLASPFSAAGPSSQEPIQKSKQVQFESNRKSVETSFGSALSKRGTGFPNQATNIRHSSPRTRGNEENSPQRPSQEASGDQRSGGQRKSKQIRHQETTSSTGSPASDDSSTNSASASGSDIHEAETSRTLARPENMRLTVRDRERHSQSSPSPSAANGEGLESLEIGDNVVSGSGSGETIIRSTSQGQPPTTQEARADSQAVLRESATPGGPSVLVESPQAHPTRSVGLPSIAVDTDNTSTGPFAGERSHDLHHRHNNQRDGHNKGRKGILGRMRRLLRSSEPSFKIDNEYVHS